MIDWVSHGFNLVSGFSLCGVVALAANEFLIAMSKTEVKKNSANDPNFTYSDVLMFGELKAVALQRAAADNLSSVAEQMVQIKRCDDKIISLSERINCPQKKVG
jgi:hypothetical protein